MYKYQDIKLKFDRRLRDSLKDIYGIGFQRASYICDFLGFGSSYNINLLNKYYYELIVSIFKFYYILEERLRNIILQRLTYFFDIRLISGIRLSKGLPVRGQRTHSNRQNPRNLKPFLVKKEKEDKKILKKKDKIQKLKKNVNIKKNK